MRLHRHMLEKEKQFSYDIWFMSSLFNDFLIM